MCFGGQQPQIEYEQPDTSAQDAALAQYQQQMRDQQAQLTGQLQDQIAASNQRIEELQLKLQQEQEALAADLASFFSRARGNKLTPVNMVPIENLKRLSGSLPGTVSHRGGKVLWGKAERAAKYFHQK